MLEDPPLLFGVVPLAQDRIGQHLEATLAVQLRRDRGHHAVLSEEAAHRLGIHALGRELGQVEDGVVAVHQIHLSVTAVDLVSFHAELGGVGVEHLYAVVVAVVFDQPALLVDALQLVLGLHQADGPAGSAHHLQVLHQRLQQQDPRVGQAGEPDTRVLSYQQRDHHVVHHFLDRGDQVQPPDPGEIRLDETEGVLPDGAGVIHHAVEPVEDRVSRLHRGCPAGSEPFVLDRVQPEEIADGRVAEVELGHPEQSVVQRPGDRVEIGELLGEQRDGAGEHPDRLHPAVVEVVHVPRDRARPHALVRRRQLGGREGIQRLPHPGRQARAAQSCCFGGGGLGRRGGAFGHGTPRLDPSRSLGMKWKEPMCRPAAPTGKRGPVR